MSDLQTIMAEIKKIKIIAESDPGNDVKTRRFKLGKKKQAQLNLEGLYMEYRKQVRDSAVFMLVTGDQADKFAKTANKEYQCFDVEADAFYQEILDQVPERLYLKKLASRAFFEHLAARFEDRARAVDIVGYPPLFFDLKYKRVIASKEDALAMTKKAMNEKIGSEIVALDAIEKVSIQSVNSNFTGSVIPIVLYTKDEELAAQLLTGLARITKNVFIIKAGESSTKELSDKAISDIKNVTKENVEKTLTKIHKSVL